MRHIEVLQPRAVVFKGASDHIFIPGTNELSEEFEDELSKRKGWQKSLDRLQACNVIRLLKEGETGTVVDASATPFGVKQEAAFKIIDAQTSIPTLERWARSKKAKGALKRKIEEQIALMRLEAEEQKS
jgi:hypothetical protein